MFIHYLSIIYLFICSFNYAYLFVHPLIIHSIQPWNQSHHPSQNLSSIIIYLFNHPSIIYLSTNFFIHSSIHPTTHLIFHHFSHWLIYPFIYLLLHPFHPSISIHPLMYPAIKSTIWPPTHPSNHLPSFRPLHSPSTHSVPWTKTKTWVTAGPSLEKLTI